MGHSCLAVIMKCFALFALASVAFAPLVYGAYGALPYAAPGYALPYAAPHVAYAHPLDSGLVYPVAEAYVHDATGDVSDNSPPEAEAYVHDTTGDAQMNKNKECETIKK